METNSIESRLGRNASILVVLPVIGLAGGLIVGIARARYLSLADLQLLTCVIKWTVTGFFGGLGAVLLTLVQTRRGEGLTVRRLMAIVALAAAITWFVTRVFSTAIGGEGF